MAEKNTDKSFILDARLEINKDGVVKEPGLLEIEGNISAIRDGVTILLENIFCGLAESTKGDKTKEKAVLAILAHLVLAVGWLAEEIAQYYQTGVFPSNKSNQEAKKEGDEADG